MPLLRLAYSALFLIALTAFYVAWSQVGGQAHVDLLPWWIKLVLGTAMALAVVRATCAAVAGERAWNGQTLKWVGLSIAVGIICGLATYYAHMYLEETDEPDSESQPAISALNGRRAATHISAPRWDRHGAQHARSRTGVSSRM